jgi:hypothetical protein
MTNDAKYASVSGTPVLRGVLVGGRITDHCLVKATTDTHLLQLGKSLVLGNNTTCCWLAPR